MRLKKIISATLITLLTLIAFLQTCTLPTTNNFTQNTAAAAYPSTINFSGYTWYIENSEQRVNPGPNYWSNNPQNVWVDGNGWLHLQITNRNGKWYCAELTTTKTLGYGTYAFYTASRVDTLDKNVVLGLFGYKDDSHEVDIEYSKWGISTYNNGRFTVQPPPYVDGRNQKSFSFQLYGDYSTHYFTWSQRSIFFESFGGHYPIGTQPTSNIIKSFTSNVAVSAVDAHAHINLWLYQGHAPSNGLPTEVIIKSFQYLP
jgi:hypothetical protein